MASRYRWMVLLGPPVILLAGWSVPRTVPQVVAGSLPEPARVAACAESGTALTSPIADGTGTWWTQDPDLDGSGGLTGWTLTIGSPHVPPIEMPLPPGSIVTGPVGGRVVVATDDGTNSEIRIIDTLDLCASTVSVDGAVARRALPEPAGDGFIVHLLDRRTRQDLGVWRLLPDGSARAMVVPPAAATVLQGVGIDRVWATDLRLSADGTRLAVQSCDPEACVTRIVDLRTGTVTTIDAAHGALVGFAGDRLITQAACSGLPCDILAWDVVNRRPTTIATGAIGAAVSGDGHVVVAVRNADGTSAAIATDPNTGHRQSLGTLEPGAMPLGGAGTAGIETLPGAVGLTRTGGSPTILAIDPPTSSNREVQP